MPLINNDLLAQNTSNTSTVYVVPDHFSGIATVYVCATMWHENEVEMTQMIDSVIRY
jgi:hypothetical protein